MPVLNHAAKVTPPQLSCNSGGIALRRGRGEGIGGDLRKIEELLPVGLVAEVVILAQVVRLQGIIRGIDDGWPFWSQGGFVAVPKVFHERAGEDLPVYFGPGPRGNPPAGIEGVRDDVIVHTFGVAGHVHHGVCGCGRRRVVKAGGHPLIGPEFASSCLVAGPFPTGGRNAVIEDDLPVQQAGR